MISITPNLKIEDILVEFQPILLTTKIEISLDIHKREQTSILNCISDQISMLTNLQNLTLTFENHCWIEDYSALERALQNLKSLNSFSVEFKDNCFASEKGIEWIAQGLNHSTNIHSFSVSISTMNCVNLRVIECITNCIQSLQKLETLTLNIREVSQLSNDGIFLFSEGLKKCSGIKELTLQFDLSNVDSEGVTYLSNTLTYLENIIGLSLQLNHKQKKLVNIHQLFNSISSKINLKKLILNFQNNLQINQEDEEAFINCLSNLIHLEEFSLFGLINSKQHPSCFEVLKVLTSSPSNNLQHLKMDIVNFNEIPVKDLETLIPSHFKNLKKIQKIEFVIRDSQYQENNQFLRHLATCFVDMKELNKLDLIIQKELNTQDFQYFSEQLTHLVSLSHLSINYRYNVSSNALFALRSSIQRLSRLSELTLEIPISLQGAQNALENIPNITALNIEIYSEREQGKECCKSTLLKNLSNLTNLTSLILQLDGFKIQEEQQLELLEQISHLVKLKSLNISYQISGTTQIIQQIKKTFQQLIDLEYVNLYISQCSVISFNQIFSSFEKTSLRNLDLSLQLAQQQYQFQEEDEVISCSLNHLKDLNLNVFQNNDETIEDLFIILRKCKSLQNFMFTYWNYQNQIDENFFIFLSRYLHGNLNLLNISFDIKTPSSVEVQDRGFKLIGESLETLQNLKDLTINLDQCSDVSYPVMSHIKHLPNLKQIHLTIQYDFQDIIISNFEKCQFSQNNLDKFESDELKSDLEIDSKGVKMSEQIKFFKHPQMLFLNSVKNITDEGLSNIGKILQQANSLNQLLIDIREAKSFSQDSITELSKGISNQSSLTRLTFLEIQSEESINFILLLEGLKKLKQLKDLTLVFPFTSIVDSFQVIGESIREMKELNKLKLKSKSKNNESITNQNGLIQIYDSLPHCTNLQNLDIEISKTQILDEVGVESLNRGLDNLTNITILNIGFILGETQLYSDQIILDFSKTLKQMQFLRNLNLKIENQSQKNFHIMYNLTSAIDSHLSLSKIEITTYEDFNTYPFQIKNLLIKLKKKERVILKIDNQWVMLKQAPKLDLKIVLHQNINEDTLEILMEGITSITPSYQTLLNFSNIVSNHTFSEIIKEKITHFESNNLQLFIKDNQNQEFNVWNILDRIDELQTLKTLGLYLDCQSLTLENIKQLVQKLNRLSNLSNIIVVIASDINENNNIYILRQSILEFCSIKRLKTIIYNAVDQKGKTHFKDVSSIKHDAYKLQPRLVTFQQSKSSEIKRISRQLQL